MGMLQPVLAFFDASVDDIIAAANSDTVEGVWAAPGNGSVILVWNTKKNAEDVEAVGYRVEYGTKSVAKKEAEQYEAKKEIEDKYPTAKVEDLKNNTEYFFTVIAVFPDGSETPPSEEVSATPLSELTQEADEAPIVISAESLSRSQVSVVFSEEIILPEENPQAAFAVALEKDEDEALEVTGAQYAVNEDTKLAIKTEVILTTADQVADESYRVTASALITDSEDNPIESGSTDNALFDGTDTDPIELVTAEEDPDAEPSASPTPSAEESATPTPSPEASPEAEEGKGDEEKAPLWDDEDLQNDKSAPEEVTNIKHSLKARISDFLVSLSWTASKNTAKDLKDQLIYRSENFGTSWGKGKSLGASTTSTTMSEKPETEITYKITTKDVAGNESVGAIHSVSLPALPATGPGLLIPGGIALFAAAFRRLRKQQ
jgi:hypothetical protein